MHKIFRPLMDYISEQLNIKVDIVIPGSYEELMKRTAAGEIDFASFNAVTLLKALHAGMPIRYLCTTMKKLANTNESHDYYEGYIIVRKDSPYKKLEDLRGKKFAFVDTDSASGYKMPSAYLAKYMHTTPKNFFRKYFFVGDHNKVASAVYYGSVDGGATWDNSYMLNTAKDKFGDAFRIIHVLSPIPNDSWVTGPKVDEELSLKLKNLLLSITEATKTADGKFVIDVAAGFPGTGWSERTPQFYEDKADLLLFEPK